MTDRLDDEYKAEIFSQIEVTHFNTGKIKLHNIAKEVGRQIDLTSEPKTSIYQPILGQLNTYIMT